MFVLCTNVGRVCCNSLIETLLLLAFAIHGLYIYLLDAKDFLISNISSLAWIISNRSIWCCYRLRDQDAAIFGWRQSPNCYSFCVTTTIGCLLVGASSRIGQSYKSWHWNVMVWRSLKWCYISRCVNCIRWWVQSVIFDKNEKLLVKQNRRRSWC